MVGFGSSLRLARRPGWEGAYLDYEALKLLLSHMEAIYEEGTHHHPSEAAATSAAVTHHHPTSSSHRRHHQHQHRRLTHQNQPPIDLGSSWELEDDVYIRPTDRRHTSRSRHHHNNESRRRRRKMNQSHRKQQQHQDQLRRRSKYDRQPPSSEMFYRNHENIHETTTTTNTVRDYKVDLFLESDSDRAYISVDDPYDDDDDDEDDDDFTTDDDEADQDHPNILQDHHHLDGTMMMEDTVGGSTVKPFAMSSYTQMPHDDRGAFHGPYDDYIHDDHDYDSGDNLMIIQPAKNGTSSSSCWGGGNGGNHNQITTGKTTTFTSGSSSTTKRKSKSRNHHPRSHRKGVGSTGSSQLLLPGVGGGGGGSSNIQHQPQLTEEDYRTRPPQYHDIASASSLSSQPQHPPPITPPWKATYPYYGDTTHTDATSFHYFVRPVDATTTTASSVMTTMGGADESTALLSLLQAPALFHTPSHNNNNKNGSMSPPHRNYFWNPSQVEPASTTTIQPSLMGIHSTVPTGTFAPGVGTEMSTKKRQPKHTAQEIRRKQERRRKRREQLQRLRQQREKKVPRHIRIAHTKARAITERFLGLLRAETEKVLLFAQSRLGELADTAGSLRFPSYDEEYASNHPSITGLNTTNMTGVATGNDYEFGDGGMHPSASSSSDDQYNAGNSYGRQLQQQQQQQMNQQPWFSDSSEDENDDPSNHLVTAINSLSNHNISSAGGISKTDTTSSNSVKIGTTATTTRSKEADHLRYIQRQIAHFTELRKRRAIFQRNEQILGEDMLFLSAVEEVDGYTAVGVELLHTLKYICINLIAVRKICRKHDRLLMNRMLGGYYHRLRKRKTNIAGVQTLGGMVTQISGDIYEAHPSVLVQRNHFKLVGVYDFRLQNLANSRTVQVVSSCLALSLSEYEVARSRADALARFNSVTSMDSGSMRHGNNNAESDDTEDESLHDDVPSTTSNISLTRLRYTIMSIFALREVSRTKRDCLMTYLSRVSLAFTGQPVIGEGLDGCSRETLDFLVSYNPDTALLSDVMLLYEGLKQNRWSHLPIGDVMIATLAAATIQSDLAPEVKLNMLHREEDNVAYAVSANPDSNVDFWKAMLNGQPNKISALSNRTVVIRHLPPIVLRLSRTSLFLYSLNYFLSHATAATFVKATGSPASYSAVLIGIPNLSSVIMALFHCWYGATRDVSVSNNTRFSFNSVKAFMIFGTFMGMIGNGIHGYAINKSSIMWAIVGRLCFGFSSAEILQRELMSMCVPVHVIAESGKLTMSKMIGSALGMTIGTLLAIPIAVQTLDIGRVFSPHTRQLQWSSWMMMAFWSIHLLVIFIQCRVKGVSSTPHERQVLSKQNSPITKEQIKASKSSDSESSSSAVIGSPSTVLLRPPLDAVEPIQTAVSSMENISNTISQSNRRDDDLDGFRQRRQISRQWRTLRRLRRLLAFHVGIPIALLIYGYTSFSMEIFCTTAPIIGDRYFSWSGARAGTFLACLLFMTLPVTVACEIVARRYEERTVIKRALTISCAGLLIMINWQSMFSLAQLFPSLLADTPGRLSHPYDGKLGVIQYVIGLVLVYISFIALEGAALSLLSKLSPINLRSIIINVGTMSTFTCLIARLLGDAHIVAIDVSHKLINTDIVNALVVPLILASFWISYLIKKNFFVLT